MANWTKGFKRMCADINSTLPPGLTVQRLLLIFGLGIAFLFALMHIVVLLDGKPRRAIKN
jgi:hypothetical protein